MAAIPQFQKNGEVPNRALTLGTPRTSWALLTSGKFLGRIKRKRRFCWIEMWLEKKKPQYLHRAAIQKATSSISSIKTAFNCKPYTFPPHPSLLNIFRPKTRTLMEIMHETLSLCMKIHCFQSFLFLRELTTDKHLSFQFLFQSQCWAFHYKASVWPLLLIE